MADLATNIYYWAYGNESRISEVQDWHTTALQSIVAGGGKDVIQSTANNVSVTFSSGMSNQSWFDTLTRALVMLQTNVIPPKRKQAYFPCPDFNNQ